MRVLEARVFRGPSIYAYRTVIRLKLDFGTLEEYPTDRLPGFAEGLLALLIFADDVPRVWEQIVAFQAATRRQEGDWALNQAGANS